MTEGRVSSRKQPDRNDPLDPVSRIWQDPFIVQPAPTEDTCVVKGCKWGGRAKWQVEVIGYYGNHTEPLSDSPTFTACSSHLTQQLNRWVKADV